LAGRNSAHLPQSIAHRQARKTQELPDLFASFLTDHKIRLSDDFVIR
jgi:hypothetical protein